MSRVVPPAGSGHTTRSDGIRLDMPPLLDRFWIEFYAVWLLTPMLDQIGIELYAMISHKATSTSEVCS